MLVTVCEACAGAAIVLTSTVITACACMALIAGAVVMVVGSLFELD